MIRQTDFETAQFENMNALRAYPFAEGSSLVDRLGRELSKDVIVDVRLVVPGSFDNPSADIELGGLPTVRMTSVHLSPVMISVCFVSELNGTKHAASVTLLRNSLVPYYPVRLEKLVGEEDIGGIVTFGDFTFPGSPMTYFLESAVIHPTCIAVRRPTQVRKFVDLRSGDVATGDVALNFQRHIVAACDDNKIALSLESGSEAELASECAEATDSDVCGATPIETINGILPDEDGNLVLWFH